MPLSDSEIEAIANRVHEKMKDDPPLFYKTLGDMHQLAEAMGKWTTVEEIIKLKCLAGVYQATGRDDLLRHSVSAINSKGFLMEFGVAHGVTINVLSELTPQRKWYGFDSFEGLPEDWHWYLPKGHFSLQGSRPAVNANVELVPGMFEDSIPIFIGRYAEELKRNGIAMIHIDCDLYSSAKSIFRLFQPYLSPGTVIQFDEYWYYPDWSNGEAKAFDEFIKASEFGYRPLGYITSKTPFSIVLTTK